MMEKKEKMVENETDEDRDWLSVSLERNRESEKQKCRNRKVERKMDELSESA